MNTHATRFYAAVFLISSCIMSLQILQSRLFSVTSWYHLSFLVISLAMFGLTLGALKIYQADEQEQRKNYGLIARKHSLFFGFFIIIALLTQLFIPLSSSNLAMILTSLPIAAAMTSIAYYHAGIVITVSLTRAPFPVGRTYGIDLLGAGLGCIAALLLMENVDTPSGLLLLAGMACLSSLLFPSDVKNSEQNLTVAKKTMNIPRTATALFVFLMVAGTLNALSTPHVLYPLWVKERLMPNSLISYEEWNSISRVTVFQETLDTSPFLWGPSSLSPDSPKTTRKWLVIDGDAGTPITKFDGDWSGHSYLEYDVTNIAYTLPNITDVAIVGVGGGRDVLSAKYFGAETVTALDVNPVQIDLLRDHPVHREYAALYDLPGVEFINNEARSWFRNNEKTFDLIQMSLIDTWAATGAGAFALSENGLYTVQAWSIFLNDLKKNGVFTVSRWSSDNMNDTGRLMSVSMAALFDRGVENPADHLVITTSAQIANMIISRSPFTKEQLAALRRTAQEKDYKIIIAPDQPAPEGVLGELLQAKDTQALFDISDKQFFDVSPSTDMRPFFFNQARLTKPLDIIKYAFFSTEHNVAHGQAKATFNLFLIIVFSVLIVGFVIIYPLAKTLENRASPFVLAGSLYFMLIGLGFMFIEISLLQALGVFLGHPIFGLGVVLFSLIISAGVGSLVSDRVPLNTTAKQILWGSATCAYGIFLALALKSVFTTWAEVEIMTRILISVGLIFPGGFLMGFGFPTGLSLAEKFDSRATAWFWGINGAAGVLGSSVGLALNIAIGIDKTLIVGSACYALLTISFLVFAKLGRAQQSA